MERSTGADETAPDGKNEILFASIAEPGTVAVTIVWGDSRDRRSGASWSSGNMVSDSDLTWGNAGPGNETALGDTSVMDFWNVFTHEAGHAAGLSPPRRHVHRVDDAPVHAGG